MRYKILVPLLFLFCPTMTAQRVLDSLAMQHYTHYTESAYKMLDRHEPDSAKLMIERALHTLPKAPTNYLLHALLSQIYLSQKDTVQAISELTTAITQQPNDPTLHEGRGLLLAQTGRLNDALLDYDMVIQRLPKRESALFNRAWIRSLLGLYAGAEEDLKTIVRNNDKAYSPRLAMSTIKIQEGDKKEAEKILNYLINTFPKTPGAYYYRIRLFLLEDRKAMALQDVRTLIKINEDKSPRDYILMGIIFGRYGEKKESLKNLQEAIARGATQKDIEQERAWLSLLK